MKIETIKGHLLVRKANLSQQGQAATIRVLQLENNLRGAREEMAAIQGALQELDGVLARLEESDVKAE